ncbi:glycyl-radical enzyme activating protein [uncultured Desulfovibrio sp.]|uniref:(2S)-3-sulfopropanediol dehydratase activating enzyme n=1 Tax=uncultured Desulfovibrio sp. TaxID=167968 RepID=UPI0025F39DF3|nr:glycyl-radical enzyme activating protein [uncultured Desulfovibrio sp.]
MYQEDYDDDQDLAREGMVFNIQKYSVHDGPGIRTIVFLKGCALRCRWCSNPESQNTGPELAWNEGRCIGLEKCGHCLEACDRGALTPGADGKPVLHREKCGDCAQACAGACPPQGLLVYGKRRTAGDVLDAVEQDMAFYTRSGGGMTLSGGEPLLQRDFAVALLRQARQRRMKTAIETCGMVPEENIRAAAPWLSYALFDIKHMDAATHKEQTGADNARILANFRILAEEFPTLPILARTPVIPGFNDTPEAIESIARFLEPFGHVRYEMLPYHRLGTQKYHFLHREPPMGDITLEKSRMPRLQQVALDILGERVQIPK